MTCVLAHFSSWGRIFKSSFLFEEKAITIYKYRHKVPLKWFTWGETKLLSVFSSIFITFLSTFWNLLCLWNQHRSACNLSWFSWPAGGIRLRRGLWENDPTSHLIVYLRKLFLNDFMVSMASFRSSSKQHKVYLVDDDHIQSEMCWVRWSHIISNPPLV